MSKQDRQGVRKPSDVERKYNLGNVVKTVRVIQESSSIPDDVLGDYYTKAETVNMINVMANEIKEDLSSQVNDYRIVDGIVEWFNPPMQLDVEYRTTERLMGKPVFTKLVEQDISLRGSTTDEYEAPYQIEIDVVTPNLEQYIRANGHTAGYTNEILPQISENGYMVFGSMSADKIIVDVKNHLFTNDAHLYIQLWYTKTE